jgi:hypothetical protein
MLGTEQRSMSKLLLRTERTTLTDPCRSCTWTAPEAEKAGQHASFSSRPSRASLHRGNSSGPHHFFSIIFSLFRAHPSELSHLIGRRKSGHSRLGSCLGCDELLQISNGIVGALQRANTWVSFDVEVEPGTVDVLAFDADWRRGPAGQHRVRQGGCTSVPFWPRRSLAITSIRPTVERRRLV